jgi:hypothetical protein
MSRVIPFPAATPAHDQCSVLPFPASSHDTVASSRRRHRHPIGLVADTGCHPASGSPPEPHASVVVIGAFDRFRQVPPSPPEPTAA